MQKILKIEHNSPPLNLKDFPKDSPLIQPFQTDKKIAQVRIKIQLA